MSFAESIFRDDDVFNNIESDYLTLADNECKNNSKLLKAIVEEKLIPLMKRNTLFETIFNRVAFGGSYYKGTKYGSPDEFDLYLVHKFDYCKADLEIDLNRKHSGYVKIKVNYKRCDRQVTYEEELKKITHFNDENKFLDQNKFRAWLEGVFIKALGTLSRDPYYGYELYHDGRTYFISHRKSGPALTIMIRHPSGRKLFDVDLVPAIEFDGIRLKFGYWAPAAHRRNTTHTVNATSTTNSTEHKKNKNKNFGYKRYNDNKLPFMVVPKPLNKSIPSDNLYWRLSFFQNEKAMLRGEVKSVIKMMKKFRDTQEMKSIKSYFIETIFYHELESHKNNLEKFLGHSKTQLFIHGLRKLREALKKGKLPYFWNEGLDLFQKMSRSELENHANRLGFILKDIEENIENDSGVLEKHICGTS